MRYILFQIIFFFAFLAMSSGVHAACSGSELAGVWSNPNAGKEMPRRIEIMHTCEERDHGGYVSRGKSAQNETWTVRAFHKCTPKNCVWGRVSARKNSKDELIAVFNTFSARRSLKISPGAKSIIVDYGIDYRSARKNDLKGQLYMWLDQ
ncbi:MAG: hypothetical protein AAF228_06875 [Pseudomonadota bacterium]